MSWTDDRVTLLRKLWGDGFSASQIANELGGVTRNAVIGKAHRLGLSGRPNANRGGGSRPRAERARKAEPSRPSFNAGQVMAQSQTQQPQTGAVVGNLALKQQQEARIDEAALSQPYGVVEVEPLEIAPGEGVSLLDLNERTCKWPIGHPGDDDFQFCGKKATVGHSYCDHHCNMAYQPARRR